MDFQEEEDVWDDNEMRKRKFFCCVMMLEMSNLMKAKRSSKPANPHRDRRRVIDFISNWSDSMFRRQFRLSRTTFSYLLEKIERKYPISETSERKAINSSGSVICNRLRLYIMLRILAGASYLDMIWYEVSVDNVFAIVVDMVKKVDDVLADIIDLPKNANDLKKIAKEWSDIQIRKHGFSTMPGTLLAGDGLVIQINAPTKADLDRRGISIEKFRNRKCCFAIICLAFCDAKGRFRYWEISWPGSTSDITAYKQTALYRRWRDDPLLKPYHMVLDAIFSSIGGDQHLTPYSKEQLRRARIAGKYIEYRAYNAIQSGERITIEGAFGKFIRRWGFFWKPIEYDIDTTILIARVCAKLHNLCIDMNENEAGNHGIDANMRTDDQPTMSMNDDQPTDSSVMEVFENLYLENRTALRRSTESTKRDQIRINLQRSGLAFSSANDYFTYNN